MLKPKISSIVYAAANQFSDEDKVYFLRENDSLPLRIMLGMTLDEKLQWAIPPGPPPYKPNESPDCEMALYHESKKMNRFHEGGPYANLKQRRREELFITMLQALDADDARFLIEVVINKTLPEGLTKEIVKAAFPDMRV